MGHGFRSVMVFFKQSVSKEKLNLLFGFWAVNIFFFKNLNIGTTYLGMTLKAASNFM